MARPAFALLVLVLALGADLGIKANELSLAAQGLAFASSDEGGLTLPGPQLRLVEEFADELDDGAAQTRTPHAFSRSSGYSDLGVDLIAPIVSPVLLAGRFPTGPPGV